MVRTGFNTAVVREDVESEAMDETGEYEPRGGVWRISAPMIVSMNMLMIMLMIRDLIVQVPYPVK